MRVRSLNLRIAFASLLALVGAVSWGMRPVHAAELVAKKPASSTDQALLELYERPSAIPAPDDNAITPARVDLGRMLFFDPRLSRSKLISCASCHNPSLSWADGNARATGDKMKELGRRTPTVLNLAWAPALFWDGRAETLEEQALGPIQGKTEMNLPLPEMERRIRMLDGYTTRFNVAYPNESISGTTVAMAIASFERTIVSEEAPFDAWVRGDESAVSADAKEGFRLFNGKANCASCHSGWRLTDDSFHDIGATGADSGRGRMLPDIDNARFAFKTPTLRNVAVRYPYMHDGSERTLDDVIELYNVGGRVKRPSLSADIRPLHLSPSDKRRLVAFLQSLTSRAQSFAVPPLPR